jgi:hypothetical protein
MSTAKGLVPDTRGANALERISLYLHTGGDESVLHPKDKEIFARLTFVDDQLRNLFTGPETVVRLMARYPTISKATALMDLTNARKVFGATSVHDRNHNKDMIDGIIKKAIRKAFDRQDLKAVASLTKNLIILHGLDREPVDEALKKLKAHVNVFTFDPKLLGIEQGSGGLDDRISKFLNKKEEAEYADWTSV